MKKMMVIIIFACSLIMQVSCRAMDDHSGSSSCSTGCRCKATFWTSPGDYPMAMICKRTSGRKKKDLTLTATTSAKSQEAQKLESTGKDLTLTATTSAKSQEAQKLESTGKDLTLTATASAKSQEDQKQEGTGKDLTLTATASSARKEDAVAFNRQGNIDGVFNDRYLEATTSNFNDTLAIIGEPTDVEHQQAGNIDGVFNDKYLEATTSNSKDTLAIIGQLTDVERQQAGKIDEVFEYLENFTAVRGIIENSREIFLGKGLKNHLLIGILIAHFFIGILVIVGFMTRHLTKRR